MWLLKAVGWIVAGFWLLKGVGWLRRARQRHVEDLRAWRIAMDFTGVEREKLIMEERAKLRHAMGGKPFTLCAVCGKPAAGESQNYFVCERCWLTFCTDCAGFIMGPVTARRCPHCRQDVCVMDAEGHVIHRWFKKYD